MSNNTENSFDLFYNKLNIYLYDKVTSTNDLAREKIKNSSIPPFVIIANEQTHGKGCWGRKFFSPPNTGLYMSLVVNLKEHVNKIAFLTSYVAVAVCIAIDNLTKLNPKIKWVNDIYLSNKKVCGILTERVSCSSSTENVIIGIGINVATDKSCFPDSIKDIAISLNQRNLSKNILAKEIIKQIYLCIAIKDHSTIFKEYSSYSLMQNKKIAYVKDNKKIIGTVIGINSNFHLVVKKSTEDIEVISSGSVSLI